MTYIAIHIYIICVLRLHSHSYLLYSLWYGTIYISVFNHTTSHVTWLNVGLLVWRRWTLILHSSPPAFCFPDALYLLTHHQVLNESVQHSKTHAVSARFTFYHCFLLLQCWCGEERLVPPCINSCPLWSLSLLITRSLTLAFKIYSELFWVPESYFSGHTLFIMNVKI